MIANGEYLSENNQIKLSPQKKKTKMKRMKSFPFTVMSQLMQMNLQTVCVCVCVSEQHNNHLHFIDIRKIEINLIPIKRSSMKEFAKYAVYHFTWKICCETQWQTSFTRSVMRMLKWNNKLWERIPQTADGIFVVVVVVDIFHLPFFFFGKVMVANVVHK